MPSASPAEHKKTSVGPTVGIIIIVILLAFGALYFWGAKLNSADQNQPLPLIPGDSTSTY
jgi:hypothetical protein